MEAPLDQLGDAIMREEKGQVLQDEVSEAWGMQTAGGPPFSCASAGSALSGSSSFESCLDSDSVPQDLPDVEG